MRRRRSRSDKLRRQREASQRLRPRTIEPLEDRLMLTITPSAEEFLISDFVHRRQATGENDSALAANENGDFVVAFSGKGPVDNSGVFARRFSSDGSALGDYFRVNSTIRETQSAAAVALADNGTFVVAWQGRGPGDQRGIFAQWFDRDSQPLGGEVLVNTTTGGSQENPSIALLGDGSAVIAWDGPGIGDHHGVFQQRFDSNRFRVGSETRVNSHIDDLQAYPSMAAQDDGYVVAWSSKEQDGSDWGIFAQRYDTAGQAVGDELAVNNSTLGSQFYADVATRDDGGFVVAYGSYQSTPDSWDIFAQPFDTSGVRIGTANQLNTDAVGHQFAPQAISMPGGGYAAVWTHGVPDGSGWEVQGRSFAADGTAEEPAPVTINSVTSGPSSGHQSQAFIAPAANASSAAIVWSGNGQQDHGGVYFALAAISVGGVDIDADSGSNDRRTHRTRGRCFRDFDCGRSDLYAR